MGMGEHSVANESRFCWEQVQRANPLFRVSRVFAPRPVTERLLPLYALFATVELACSEFSDESVARQKLQWWRNECLIREPGTSSHPVLRALDRSGGLPDLHRAELTSLLDHAEYRIDAPGVTDMDGLRKLCEAVARPQRRLEIHACGGAESTFDDFPAGKMAGLGLAQLIREGERRRGGTPYGWVPLELLARHGLSRRDLEQNPGAPSARSLLDEILGAVLDWSVEDEALLAHSGPQQAPARHLAVMSELQMRALVRLRGTQLPDYGRELGRASLADVYQAWRTARRISRRK